MIDANVDPKRKWELSSGPIDRPDASNQKFDGDGQAAFASRKIRHQRASTEL